MDDDIARYIPSLEMIVKEGQELYIITEHTRSLIAPREIRP